MKVFELNNNQLSISEEAYALTPFKKLWDRDKSSVKNLASAELAYVFFMEDFRSDFADLVDESERSKEVISFLTLPKNWKADQAVEEARRFYQRMNDSIMSIAFLRDVRKAVDEVRKYCREVDLLALDSKGGPLWSSSDVARLTSVISQSSNMLKSLADLERTVRKEMEDQAGVRGSKVMAEFEDGL